MRITSLHLQNFRNFERLAFESLPPFVAFVGENGAGKTNILEAISLLTPGRGLRNAALPHLMRQSGDAKMGWGVKAATEKDITVATGWQAGMSKRGLTIGADSNAKQKDLAEFMTAHWLTPAMDRLLADAPAGRRRFIDRLVFALDPAHAGRITRYEKAVLERMRLLKEGRAKEAEWLSGLELDAAHSAASIAAARVSWMKRIAPYLSLSLSSPANAVREGDLNQPKIPFPSPAGSAGNDSKWRESDVSSFFPQPKIEMHGLMEAGLLSGQSALILEQQMTQALARARHADTENGTCSVGPHRTDIAITYAQKNQDARLASTGEQKALLISLILAQTHMLSDERGIKPILLLDDIASHLDENRRNALLTALFTYTEGGGQVFMTGTDKNPFKRAENGAFLIEVGAP